MLTKAVVFARAKPEDKRYIVTELMRPPALPCPLPELAVAVAAAGSSSSSGSGGGADTGKGGHNNRAGGVGGGPAAVGPERDAWHVMFCGDGANDMAALRAATVGLSLCDVETSIAAPITAKHPTPKAVVDVLLEGRVSLTTCYVLVHFNIMSAVILLFFTCILYGYGLMVSEAMYLVQVPI